jgi:hypothetical protein
LIGCPISRPSLLPALILNQGPFPPPALPGFNGTTGLSVTPQRPDLPSRASGWSSPTTPRGFPCCVCLPCVHAVATTPAQRRTVLPCSIHSVVSAFPERVVGSACASSFRGLLGVHSRYGLHTRAVTIFRGTLHRRLQRLRYLHRCSGCFRLEHFAGWAFHPLEQHRLFTAHTQSRSRLRGQDIYLPNAWELKARFCQAALDAHKALKMAAHISAIVLNHPYLLN